MVTFFEKGYHGFAFKYRTWLQYIQIMSQLGHSWVMFFLTLWFCVIGLCTQRGGVGPGELQLRGFD
jgi:hypothetical protein